MPSPLKNKHVLKASNEGTVVEWWLAPRWHLLKVCLSIELTLHGGCTDGDNALVGPRLLVAATIWNLLHPTQEDYF
jgi:hypothetical protein